MDSQNRDIEIINLESNISYKPNPSDLQKTWMQQMLLESSMSKQNSISQVVQLDIQPITMNIHNYNLMEGTTIINKKIVENDSCNRMFVESKMIINSNQSIGFNISNSNQNIISNIHKKKKVIFWSSELNEMLIVLISKCTTNNEITSKFLSQRNKLNLIFDQVI